MRDVPAATSSLNEPTAAIVLFVAVVIIFAMVAANLSTIATVIRKRSSQMVIGDVVAHRPQDLCRDLFLPPRRETTQYRLLRPTAQEIVSSETKKALFSHAIKMIHQFLQSALVKMTMPLLVTAGDMQEAATSHTLAHRREEIAVGDAGNYLHIKSRAAAEHRPDLKNNLNHYRKEETASFCTETQEGNLKGRNTTLLWTPLIM